MSKFLILYLLNIPLIYYLLTPFPMAPDLAQELRSDLPGDTIQVPNIKAFFTNWNRSQVISYYRSNLPEPYILLNHPPERAKEVVRDEIQSYYLQEFVFPLKGSIYINGYEWKNDVFTPEVSRVKNKILVGKTAYDSKITIRWYPAAPFERLLNLVCINLSISLFAYALKKSFSK